MSLLNNIRERVANAIQPKKNKAPRARGRGDRTIGSISNGNELQASLKGTVFACLQHRANALSAIKFNTFRENNYSLEELSRSHWINELLANPNPYFTRSQIYGYIENWLSINGNVFIWTPTNGYRVPLQMWVLNPTRVRVIKGSDNFVDSYVYQSAQDGNIPLPEKEIIHLARLNPAARPEEIVGMNMFGVGLVQAALDYANLDAEQSAYLQRMFSNDAMPPLIAKYPDRYDYDEWQKLKAQWNEEMPNHKLRALLSGGLSLELPPKSELGVTYDSVSSDTRKQIAQVFGVPPGMLTGDYSNRATAEVQWAIFRQNTIDPEALYIAEEFTRHFRRWEDNALVEAESYQYEDPIVKLQEEEFELKWGIKTINDARADRGYDKLPDGNVPLVANGFVPLDSLTLGIPSPAVTKSMENKLITSSFTSDDYLTSELTDKDYFWRRYDDLTTKNTISIENIVSGAIGDLTKQINRKLKMNNTNLKGLDFSDKAYADYFDVLIEACDNIEAELIRDLNLDPDNIPPTIEKLINDSTIESVNQLKESGDVIKEEVLRTFDKVKATADPEIISNALNKKFKSLEVSRAKTIAQTTSAKATATTQYTVFKENGLKMMWLSQRDGRVRFAHQQADGKFPNSAGYFTVGGEKTTRPLGPGLSVGNVVNCRCQLFPVRS